MSCGGPAVPEDHAPCGPFLPAIGRDITEKLIPTNLNRSICIQRHLVGLAQVPPGVAKIGIGNTTRRRRRWRDLLFISPVSDEDFVAMSTGHGSDVSHGGPGCIRK